MYTDGDDATVRKVFAELLRIAVWAQECVPETLSEHYGDIGPTIAKAERLLADMPASQEHRERP